MTTDVKLERAPEPVWKGLEGKKPSPVRI